MCNRKCIYRGDRNLNGCDYLSFTGKVRGCAAGEKCTKFEPGDRLQRRSDMAPPEPVPEGEKETYSYISEQKRKLKASDCTRMVSTVRSVK